MDQIFFKWGIIRVEISKIDPIIVKMTLHILKLGEPLLSGVNRIAEKTSEYTSEL